jgi:hypothetical protein
MYSMESVKPYWIWGIVATLCVIVLCFGSGLYIPNNHYEIFFLSHIVLSVILVVGCWYHAYDLYGFLGGYVYWVYAVSTVWAFDRIARVIRIKFVGSRRSVITELTSDFGYIKIDVPDVRWGLAPEKHAYLYFPTLSRWTPWESRPFSDMPTAVLTPRAYDDESHADSSLSAAKRSDGSAVA